MNNINDIGCKWRMCGNYVELDVHHSNFHPGLHKNDSPKYARIMFRNDGSGYIRHNGKIWNINKEYEFAVMLCGGYTEGKIVIKAENENAAYSKAMDYVAERLCGAFPDLDIEYSVEMI